MSCAARHIRQWNITQVIPPEVLEMLVSLDFAVFMDAMPG